MSRKIFLGVVVVAVGAAALTALGRRPSGPHVMPPPTYTGKSADLQETFVAPTLDTPMPVGKNVIWCSSFGLAWEKLRTDVAKQPIALDKGQVLADRLNRVSNAEGDLPSGQYYATAGLLKDKIIATIQSEMAKQFPAVPKPTFRVNDGGPGAVAYAYLEANTRFTIPFFDSTKPLEFVSSGGQKSKVRAFGIRHEDESGYRDLRGQTAVLYSDVMYGRNPNGPSDFIIDPCKSSEGTQIILASVKPKATLGETLKYVDAKIAEWAAKAPDPRSISLNDTLLIPNLSWRVTHTYADLEGKVITNGPLAGIPIIQAEQMIAFALDRSGAELKSEAKIVAASAPAQYHFDRPFLIVMKKRGAQRPFFVMWVDNPELLSPWKGGK